LNFPGPARRLVFHCKLPGIWHFHKLASTDIKPNWFLKSEHFRGSNSNVSVDFALGVIAEVGMVGSWDFPFGNFLKYFHLEKNNPKT
jgi:hypothetical protein